MSAFKKAYSQKLHYPTKGQHKGHKRRLTQESLMVLSWLKHLLILEGTFLDDIITTAIRESSRAHNPRSLSPTSHAVVKRSVTDVITGEACCSC
ncbi:hypothetical protein K1719_007085 [Acacia pycnantha]|nr:hypothetical protein K1719_007085 [Acacia pycnantha]